VVTTRTADEFVNLRERGRIAVRENAKLFISIHCNAINKPSISGVQTYFLSDAQTDEARAVARAENAALTYEDSTETADADGGSQEVSEILSGMVSDRYLKESQELAALVQHELVRGLGARDMGVHQAGFYVMKGTLAEMPSILVEIGYLTNAAEARRLQQASYQTQIAAAVTRAVRQFKMRYERELEH
jgi:N-acetylmuramoyl-L-alanine amidase